MPKGVRAIMICFNGHKSETVWGSAEWRFFLDDLESRLRPGGRIQLQFNREINGEYFGQDVRRLFAERGAAIDSLRVTIPSSNRNCTSRDSVRDHSSITAAQNYFRKSQPDLR